MNNEMISGNEFYDESITIAQNNQNDVCKGIRYRIKEGDTLYKISRMNNVPLGALLEANTDVNIYNLKIGDEICIPRKQQMPVQNENISNRLFVYVVKDGDTLDSILKMYNVELEDLMEANSQNKIMIRPGSIVVVPAKEKDND